MHNGSVFHVKSAQPTYRIARGDFSREIARVCACARCVLMVNLHVFVCARVVCLFVCLFACLCVCVLARLCVYVCMFDCLFICFRVRLCGGARVFVGGGFWQC